MYTVLYLRVWEVYTVLYLRVYLWENVRNYARPRVHLWENVGNSARLNVCSRVDGRGSCCAECSDPRVIPYGSCCFRQFLTFRTVPVVLSDVDSFNTFCSFLLV